jgi:triacylglycerol esterase/lipase EstA (alpha/beta hydrolase family)
MYKKIVIWTFIALFSITSIGCSSVNALEHLNIKKEKVVLIHGFGRSKMAMWPLYIELHSAGYDVTNVGYSSFSSTIDEIKKEVFEQINEIDFENYSKVHFVGHSLGGLLCRSYLDEHNLLNLGNTVLIGSPNKGTEIVDTYKDEWWFDFAGPTAKVLGTDKNSFPNSLKTPYYRVGVIAGSANVDIDLIKKAFTKEHDGMVSVDSTKVKGMLDFVKINTSHSMMRHDDEVALQTIYFLQTKQFKHK